MELLQLKYFQTVAYTEHLSNAAKQLTIAQPSLSLTIKRLEDELGTKLFDRKGRNIQLSASGKILLKHVNRIFIELENAQAEIEREEHHLANTIKIAISNPRFLSGLISEYINLSPETTIIQSIRGKSDILSSLKRGEVELGIAGDTVQDEELESRLLVNEDLVLALPSNHRLTGKTELSLSHVANEPFITLANNEEYRSFTSMLCEKAGFTPNTAFEVDSNLLVEIIKLDQGVALLPISICRKLGLNYRPLTDHSATYPVRIYWRKNKVLPSSTEGLRIFILSYYTDHHHLFKA
ncbi:LysR family transcriptional regulator [Rossellomorea marisflavi]|uniref:LysR family transcriptional regulator n=1 Tax=Rossellomorea marisflavi TaxID=189381 RepID=UPI00207A8C28|nr:LysR family transcriptional regulator [Rossellomorea marisflavi]USK90750.1 LysR family transcriptional regulator [Rossellomorea marisflavi]